MDVLEIVKHHPSEYELAGEGPCIASRASSALRANMKPGLPWNPELLQRFATVLDAEGEG